MDHAADFHGDQLRLSAFFRVKDKIPQRPKRLNRNKQATPLPTPEDEPVPNNLPASDVISSVEGIQDDILKAPEELIQDHGPCDQVTRASSSKSNGEPLMRFPSCATNATPTPKQIRPEPEGHILDLVKAFSAPKKKKIVYISKAKQRKQPMGVSSAQGKHPLPANSLVFVRASTEDGLPLPDDGEEAAESIFETDPIEDSQLGFLPAQLRQLQLNPGSRSPRISKESRGTRPSLKRTRPTRLLSSESNRAHLLASTRPRTYVCSPRKTRLSGFAAMCDGFVGEELSLPVPRAMEPKKIHMNTPKVENNTVAAKCGLQLVNGPLPFSQSTSPAVPKVKRIWTDESESLLQSVCPSVESEADRLRGPSEISSPYRAESRITNELASITAPARVDDESEFSSSDEEDPGRELEQWGLENESDEDDEPDLPVLRSTPESGEMEYFAEAMYRMNNRDESGYWSQYPGLD